MWLMIKPPWHALQNYKTKMIIFLSTETHLWPENVLYAELIKIKYLHHTMDFFITFCIFANSGRQEANTHVTKIRFGKIFKNWKIEKKRKSVHFCMSGNLFISLTYKEKNWTQPGIEPGLSERKARLITIRPWRLDETLWAFIYLN